LAASGFVLSGLFAGAAFVFASFAALGAIPTAVLTAKCKLSQSSRLGRRLSKLSKRRNYCTALLSLLLADSMIHT
jgi:hypothetical protein